MRDYLVSPVRFAVSGAVLLLGAVLIGIGGAYQYLEPAIPNVADLRDVRLQMPLRVYTRDHRLIAQIGEQRRIPLSFDHLPRHIINAFLAAEDNDFFRHSGIDYPGLLRATTQHLISGERGQGGGTITMQLARNIFLTPEKTYRRKLIEIFLALKIEREFNKQEILSLYLNKIFLGQRAYGVGAAAEVYFGKSVQALSLDEMALIAGIAQLPSRQNPVASVDRARQRRTYVLARMRANEFISEEDYQRALDAPLESKLHGPAVEVEAPYVAEMVRLDLLSRVGDEVYTGGFEVTTTIDSEMQRAANVAVRAALLEYDQRHGYRGPLARIPLRGSEREQEWQTALSSVPTRGGLESALIIAVAEKGATAYSRRHGRVNLPWESFQWARQPLPGGNVGPPLESADQVFAVGDVVYLAQQRSGEWQLVQLPQAQGAFVAMNPQDGGIAALVGGFDYYSSSFNRAVQAKRQAGSAFKPFLYSAALEHGYTPASIINDAPFVLDDAALESSWRPQNNARRFYGPTRLREALVRSQNLVSIRIMHSLGVSPAIEHISHFGFDPTNLPRNLSLALGTAQVSPLEMASAYSVFANGGFRVQPYFIDRVVAPGERVMLEASPRAVCSACWDEWMQKQTIGPEASIGGEPISTQTVSAQETAPSESSIDTIAPRAVTAANIYLMTDMMSDVVRRGTATRALQLKRTDLAGKTGTTNDGRDAWFCGFNSALVGTAWVGFDEERSLGPTEQGGRTALPMWIYFMAEALKNTPEQKLPQPPGIVSMRIAPDTGLPAAMDDSRAIQEIFMADHVPTGSGPAAESDSADGGDRDEEDSLF
jgi:penicillin-binding protein 1A